MASSFVAPAKRVGWFASSAAMNVFNSNGWTLFDAAIRWAVRPEALLVVGSTTPLSAGAQALSNRLSTTLGYGVTTVTGAADNTADAAGATLVVISEPVNDAAVE